MNKAEAISLVQGAFNADYSDEYFVRFISNLFKGEYTPLDKRRDGHYVREAFRAFVQGYRILGTYQDAEGTNLDILEVTLQREGSLERARTAQRNFIADYLKKNGRDAALVAFLSPGQHDWRFSLVKLEYSLEVKDGKLKTEEELTPAKRWSFLIGRHEGSHTVQSRFVSLLQDAEKPLLKELEEAFNIESVTDEFFKKYCELFFRMKESLDKLVEGDPAIKADFDSKELTTVDFAKKTLGQMAFLYFLQKKGWFGVAPGKPWGTGPKDFLRQLFGRREKYGKNFFDDVLEPLFYEALAQDRGVEAIYPRLNNCRMPFLNGGLFEPMNGYSWETTNIRLPDELFSNSNRTTEGDVGDGILDIFDRYNFTVNENEPLETEVAVDPEMLGKVFENLLEVKDRKSKGTFYTPREIVHYMCQESLINFLNSELKEALPREDIEALIRNGSHIIQNDAMVLEKGREGTYKFMLPESIRARARELDQALANIKVCDPAVGSGAFPLGMLNELVQARQALAVHHRSGESVFTLKLHSISHSLYGVDIDPGAVEIAKLRLWLSLVVEENEPHPLPNLEHKIMQGNSLISEYEGIKLFDESFLEETNHLEKERTHVETRLSELQREYFALHSQDTLSPVQKEELEREIRSLNKRKKAFNTPNELLGQELSIFDAPGKFQLEQEKVERLQKKIDQYVAESQRTKKQHLKEEIEQLKWDLIEASLSNAGKNDRLSEVQALRRKNIKPFFIWKLEFGDVFSENKGFDIVIGNPPYVDSEEMSKSAPVEREAISKKYITAKGNWDLYIPFWELGENICCNGGVVTFITPNKWLAIGYGKALRAFARNLIYKIADFSRFRAFQNVGVFPVVAFFQKGGFAGDIEVDIFENRNSKQVSSIFPRKKFNELENWGVLTSSNVPLIGKIMSLGKPFEEFCDLAEPFTVSEAYLLIEYFEDSEEPEDSENYFRFVNTGTIDPFVVLWGKKETTYLKNKFTHPLIRKDDFERDFARRFKQSTQEKLIFSGMRHFEVFWDQTGSYVAGKSTAIATNCSNDISFKFLLGFLNSKLVKFFFKEAYGALGMDGGINFSPSNIRKIPIVVANTSIREKMEYLVDSIIVSHQPHDMALSRKIIDEIVYGLFELSPDEIDIVETSILK